MKLPDLFSSAETLRSSFIDGLERQLAEDSLGAFILVLANALFDESIFSGLKQPLEEKFNSLNQQYTERLRSGMTINGAPDDILVFLKLLAIGFNHLKTTEYSNAEDWELQFNQLRSLRPQRNSATKISTIRQQFNQQAFHFNKSFLSKEVFWAGDIDGFDIKLFYNKFPFATLHGLLVPEPTKNLPQYLEAEMHHFISALCRNISQNIPEIVIAYNGFGAGASINHLHFQTFIRQTALPVFNEKWSHNGGQQEYPCHCQVFDNSDESWRYIDQLHQQNIPYNLIYSAGKIFCLSRKFQGSFYLPAWTESFAWYELCGGITTFNKKDFCNLDAQTISSALKELK